MGPNRLRGPLALACAALAAGCGGDADYDGFAGKDDCDDSDPFVYPGAPDDPADGIDADCDGVDPSFALPGTWALTSLDTDYSGLSLFLPNTESGELVVTDDLGAALAITATLDPEIVGVRLEIELEMEGDAEPLDGPDTFDMFVEGEQFDEQMYVWWTCEVYDRQEIACDGLLKALEVGIGATATFEAL